ncbi:hypothetical protein ACG83_40605 [Frankia sp. R43]|uniref:DF family (seleno)protein n=1 Tax=Frankia sp. R43 TaxID=269536 RepID=UPI0006CA42A1|nr:hypothetical protein [Frankia sp. R43]KPM50418.1 hypothetical protein ACG83_40605 [Frankia sp. R43]
MLIEVLYVAGCPNHDRFLDHLRRLLDADGVSEPVLLRRIDDDLTAQTTRFLGSPTLRINGRDVDPTAERATSYGLQCRLYQTAGALQGSPADHDILTALRAAATEAGPAE